MQNSVMQLRNVLAALQVIESTEPATTPGDSFKRMARRVTLTFGARPTVPNDPVLLVDDVVDSGWTLTFCAVLLRTHGSGPVYPFALAKASPRGS
jgi:ATP-dependent DNA helicase RecQ